MIFKQNFCRDKAIQAFQAILHKYDIEVGEERTRELEELRSALELQRKEFAIWTETICEPQIKLYVGTMISQFQVILDLFSIQTLQMHVREGRSRKKGDGTGHDDLHDEQKCQNFAEV